MTLKEGIPVTTKDSFYHMIHEADRIAISGHKNPDGDCVGSCVGLYDYLKEVFPDKTIDIYLDPISDKFKFLRNSELICNEPQSETPYDLFLALDCSDEFRLDRFLPMFKQAVKTINVDHHITNEGFTDLTICYPDASSTCEVLFQLFEEDLILKDCAEALYLGIVHDTGVFKHSNTSRLTMETAGALIDKGVNTSFIIDDTFYRKTYLQNQILGKALLESILILDRRMIFSILYQKDLRFFEVTASDLDGIIDQLRITSGVECAVLLHELEDGMYKVSMRSNEKVNVSAIAKEFGGGGHIRAAGCSMSSKNPRDIIMNIAERVEYQLDHYDDAARKQME